MKHLVPIVIVITGIIIGVSVVSANKKTGRMESQNNAVMESSDDAMMLEDEEGESMMKDDVMEKEGEVIEKNDTAMMEKTAGDFVVYEETDISSLEGNIVLDFSAPWCPSCRTFKSDVEANLGNIPGDMTLVLVDYDTNKELRKKYGVTTQHTFVQIDAQGNELQKWSGGSTLASVVAKVQ